MHCSGGIMIDRPRIAAWCLVLAVSSSATLILLFGMFGSHGNSLVTGCYFLLSIAGAALFGTTKGLRLGIADVLLVGLTICIAISFARNPVVANTRDIVLLVLTLAAFAAARLLRAEAIPFIRQASFRYSVVVVAVGTMLDVPALLDINDKVGRPLVFGFENAATAFSISLALLVLGFITSGPVLRSLKGLLTTALISVSTIVFAASMVRFTLLAILVVLAICFVLSARDRWVCATLAVVIVVSMAIGLWTRPINAAIYTKFAIDEANVSSPDCRSVNMDNSLEIRKVLLRDAFHLLPRAGLTGLGLNSFGTLGSFTGYAPHNDLLQAILEFGWLGGACFLGLIALPLLLVVRASADADSRFVFLFNAFFIMLSMIYGRFSGDISLFSALGLATSLISAKAAPSERGFSMQSIEANPNPGRPPP
jgi:O-antigen ligase